MNCKNAMQECTTKHFSQLYASNILLTVKSATFGVFIPQNLRNSTNQGFPNPQATMLQKPLLNIYQHKCFPSALNKVSCRRNEKTKVFLQQNHWSRSFPPSWLGMVSLVRAAILALHIGTSLVSWLTHCKRKLSESL
jgi:hypothetical protein